MFSNSLAPPWGGVSVAVSQRYDDCLQTLRFPIVWCCRFPKHYVSNSFFNSLAPLSPQTLRFPIVWRPWLRKLYCVMFRFGDGASICFGVCANLAIRAGARFLCYRRYGWRPCRHFQRERFPSPVVDELLICVTIVN